jgi:hypothetical protein
MYEDWFRETRETIAAYFQEDADMFSRLLAATSPVTDMRSNVRLAVKAYRQLHWYGELRGGFIEVHRISIKKFLSDGDKFTGGRKVWSLYQNMIGNEQVAAIDRWMLRYFGYEGDRHMDDKLYDELEYKVKVLAFKNFLTPAQMQAKIWCEMRGYGATRGFATYGQIIRAGGITRENILRRII